MLQVSFFYTKTVRAPKKGVLEHNAHKSIFALFFML